MGTCTKLHYSAWGRALARLHQAAETFPFNPNFTTWRDEISQALERLPSIERNVVRILQTGTKWLGEFPIQAKTYGLLHGDCELDNLVWNDGEPQLLDFADAMYAPYPVDVAIALQEIWADETPQRDEHVAWFCDGYRELRHLPADFLETLPRWLTLLTAFKFARLLRAYAPISTEANRAANDPPWLATMRARHQHWLDVQRAAMEWE